jgi:rare lipoprotein A
MKSRQVRIATGRPGRPDAATSDDTRPVVAAIADNEPPATAATRDAGVFLQVASFAARPNADRALALLQGAGIAAASLADGDANGQKVWRLRVGPLAAATVPDLAARIAGLGFGTPQRVRE